MKENNILPEEQEINVLPEEQDLIDRYCQLIIKMKSENIQDLLDTREIKNKKDKESVLEMFEQVHGYYKKLFDIQYDISKIRRKKIAVITDGIENQKTYMFAVDAQALNWINRLSHILNFLSTRLSEFNSEESRKRDIIIYIKSKKRDVKIFVFSVLSSAVIGILTTWIFDCFNDNYLKNKIEKKIISQDSVMNSYFDVMKKQDSVMNFNFDTLKNQNYSQSVSDSIISDKIDSIIKQNNKKNDRQNTVSNHTNKTN